MDIDTLTIDVSNRGLGFALAGRQRWATPNGIYRLHKGAVTEESSGAANAVISGIRKLKLEPPELKLETPA